MEILTTLGRTLGFSFAAGINLYATVAILGLASRYEWVDLPAQFKVFDNNLIIAVALIMYVVEFVADKVPWFDTIWDAVHTFVRPAGGALIAVATLGDASPTVQGLIALFGGAVAASTHVTKAGTRAVANTSPEPLSNWVLSLGEDVFVLGLGALALKFPLVALAIAGVLLVVIAWFFVFLTRAALRRFGNRAVPRPSEGRFVSSPR
jgi:Domain of unknown function (DUF4126)